MSDRRRHGFILLLVLGLIAASAVVIVANPTLLGLDLKGGVELVYKGQATAQSGVNATSLARAVDVMRNRVDQLGVAEPSIQTEGSNEIDVQLPNATNIQQAEREVGTTARLAFYDWEKNALVVPSGGGKAQSVASLLPAGDSNATAVSTGGNGVVAPGANSSAAGAMNFYDAVKLASQQPYSASTNNAQKGSLVFLFGAPHSKACAAAAAAAGKKPDPSNRCLLTPPVQVPTGTSPAQARQLAEQGLSPVERDGAEMLIVKQGTVVLQASPANFNNWPTYGTPDAGYYVLRDNVALFGNEITNPAQSTDQAGAPDVSFGFTGQGGNKFQNVTAQIANRGSLLSIGNQNLQQHFAVALDKQLVTVPSIDFKQYPDGITGGSGADITGGFTINTAQNLATELRLGALPINLVRISESQVSATLGQQALHQGLVAGLVGIAVVVLFLLAYYRMLGVIAVAGLLVYGIYFYALIKLIPITMTLAGIAGLILTIGVAADANIVIFERVKEEIRAGRSIRQGISIGYRKGLTAIIDANVVTIMTAFILFVLATADVKGFAFTLGIGTFVSLFTAVMATQAILMTIGNSRAVSRPSMLGAGGRRRVWKFDFMGKSRYFFTLSGVILLIGALAVGGRGLNLGIDFTSGTQISVGLQRPATVGQVRSALAVVGAGNATVQHVSGHDVGANGFQIASKYLNASQYTRVRDQLDKHFGIRANANGNQDFNSTSVGPTFGSTVTHSAVIAIIASLIVISLYVAIRFDWKFAVPVLIALAHDLLITSGVYALTGRVVSTDTVAALLTILGYSLYDTIIVFDRVRENIPRMPRAAFSQIVNRSMSEVLTRSLATTTCTLLPIIALLLFGGTTLKDFAFALLIGVASGAYSSIFIASPVLTHWKEREHGYRLRREHIIGDLGYVPAYADGGDVDPVATRVGRTGRLTAPQGEEVSAAEFEQMKQELGLDEERQRSAAPTATATRRSSRTSSSKTSAAAPKQSPAQAAPAVPAPAEPRETSAASDPAGRESGNGADVERAPDVAENEGVAPVDTPRGTGASKSRRTRRHGRRQ